MPSVTQRLLSWVAIVSMAMIPIWALFIAPKLLALPTNFSFSARVVSLDNFYDDARRAFTGAQYSTTEYRYDTISTIGRTAIIRNRFDVRKPTGEPIISVDRFYGIDRETTQHVAGLGDRDRVGHLFAPRHLQEGEGFTYWHVNYDGPGEMQYVGTETLYGLRVFHYHTDYNGVPIDQTADLTNLPGVGVTRGVELEPSLDIWVEPTTGRLVKYHDDTVAYFYSLTSHTRTTPWNHFSNTISDESVRSIVQDVKIIRAQQIGIEWYVPILFGLIGLLALAFRFHTFPTIGRISSSRGARMTIGLILIGVAGITLLAWQWDIHWLLHPIATAPAINPITAVAFILLGVSLWCSVRKPGAWNYFLGVPMCFIALWRLLTIGGVHLPWEIDRLLYPAATRLDNSHMSLYTAFAFLLLGCALITRVHRASARLRIPEIAAMAALLLSAIGVMGYMLESSGVLIYALFRTSAPHTALFLALGAFSLLRTSGDDEHISLSFGWQSSVFCVMIVTLLITMTATGAVAQSFKNASNAEFHAAVDRTTNAITGRIRTYVSALNGAEGLLTSSTEVTRDEWRTYVRTLNVQENYPGIQGIGYSLFVPSEQLAVHEEAVRAEGFPNYTVHPQGEREIYAPVYYIEPLDTRNTRALGFDMFQEPIRRSAMQQAIDTGEARMSGRVTLVQETAEDIQPGFLIYVPQYAPHSSLDTIPERRNAILGFAYAPFRAHDFVNGVIGNKGLDQIGLQIYDGPDVVPRQLLFDDRDRVVTSTETPRFEEVRTIYVAGRPWTLQFASTVNYGITDTTRALPLLVVGVGLLIGVILSLFLYVVLSSRQRAFAYAQRATEDLRRAKAEDEAVLASIGDGLVVIDATGTVRLVNKAFETLLGWKSEEILGRSFTESIPLLDEAGKKVPASRRFIMRVLRGHTTYSTAIGDTYYYQRKDGTLFPISVTASSVSNDGAVVGAVEVFRDITQEKQIDRAKTEFVSLASHQLRTPLTAIRWYTELLLNPHTRASAATRKDYVAAINDSNQRMIELVNGLLNISRIELGKFDITPKPTNLRIITQSVMDELHALVSQKRLQVKATYERRLTSVTIDPTLLRITLQNLLGNSIKYTPPGGTITVTFTRDTANAFLQIQVEDNGMGIPDSQQKQVFTKLFRADNAKTSGSDGNGLGLYIVKMMLDQIGGSIFFTSTEGQGTVFTARIPTDGMERNEGVGTLM